MDAAYKGAIEQRGPGDQVEKLRTQFQVLLLLL